MIGNKIGAATQLEFIRDAVIGAKNEDLFTGRAPLATAYTGREWIPMFSICLRESATCRGVSAMSHGDLSTRTAPDSSQHRSDVFAHGHGTIQLAHEEIRIGGIRRYLVYG